MTGMLFVRAERFLPRAAHMFSVLMQSLPAPTCNQHGRSPRRIIQYTGGEGAC
jgi:hypothetical protein